MKLNNAGNENGISEIQLKLKNAEWRIIGNRKRWIGHCPNCNKEVTYSQKVGLKRALEENRVCLDCRQDKIKKTCRERYGSDSPLESSVIFEKTLKTCEERYGKKYSFQNECIQSKVRSHLLNTYGVDSPSKLPTHKSRIQKKVADGSYENAHQLSSDTKLMRYGDENYNNQEKCKQTCLKRYGVEHVWMLPEHQIKMRATTLKKYGKTLQELAADGMKYQNTNIELKIKELLERHNIEFRRNFHLYDPTLKKHRFYDFQIKGTTILIEADGDYWHSLPHNVINDKYKDGLADTNNYKLLRFKEKDIMAKTFEDIFIPLLNENIKMHRRFN